MAIYKIAPRLPIGLSNSKPVIKKTLEAGNFRWLQPIPQGEMQGNSVIAQQQNPGYAGL